MIICTGRHTVILIKNRRMIKIVKIGENVKLKIVK